jgi:hypothetical protein
MADHMLTLALALFLIGLVLILTNPIMGLVPGAFLIVISLVVAVIGFLAKGLGAVVGFGSKKRCPECMSMIPSGAVVCAVCGYRYET